jgi:hypothetical protein
MNWGIGANQSQAANLPNWAAKNPPNSRNGDAAHFQAFAKWGRSSFLENSDFAQCFSVESQRHRGGLRNMGTQLISRILNVDGGARGLM